VVNLGAWLPAFRALPAVALSDRVFLSWSEMSRFLVVDTPVAEAGRV
jgi:hypothetical protein